ncbi:MAG TPA: AI-2E family transporter [Steroidobacteraceae bacterium]|nr:AI-2E family transporter [Steroidobacteraceae bacterium]
MSAAQPGPHGERPRGQDRFGARAEPRSLMAAVLVAAAIAGLLYLLHSILLPFVFAAVVAYVCTPLVDAVSGRLHLPRWTIALLLLALLMGAAALLGVIGMPPLIREVQTVGGDLHGSIAGFTRALIGDRSIDVLGGTVNADRIATYAVESLQQFLTGGELAVVVGWGVAALFGMLLVWVLIGYFLIDAREIAAGLLWLVPPRYRGFALRVWRELDPVLRRYFIGVALVVAYAAFAAYLGLGLVLGLHHALFLALLTGMLEIIPIVGPAAAAVIAGLVAVQHAATAWDIWAYVGYATALRLSIDQFVGPIVLGSAARVRPVVVIFCFLAGGLLLGVVGVLLAVPMALTVKVTLSVLYDDTQG